MFYSDEDGGVVSGCEYSSSPQCGTHFPAFLLLFWSWGFKGGMMMLILWCGIVYPPGRAECAALLDLNNVEVGTASGAVAMA